MNRRRPTSTVTMPIDEYQAERDRMFNAGVEAGREQVREELRALLGVPSRNEVDGIVNRASGEDET